MNTINPQLFEKVLALLGWDAGAHNQMVYDHAEQYLTGMMPQYPQIVDQLMKDRIFWKWWRNHWQLRDKEFVELCEDVTEPVETRRMIYQELHDPNTLLSAIYLNGQVLEGTYAAMIGEVTRAQKMEVAA